ncbi:MAG: HEAT repeat domain-containing protein, partial [Chloroflexi bacterium]|nr:HEAT repeat domain-containing protein [Chloroflexota bacterium]
IATSRIVGYREMGYRIGRGFEHVTVSELSREDKDDFAQRWCDLTEPPERRENAKNELIRDIHSTDRIERLTGNPMLLTTMALVKRKVGKLPSRRAELYWDAVEVLLNWRREVDEPLDHHEAVPQLEYIAYAMCDRGIQQLREDEILALLEQMRAEYPQVHPARDHTPAEFLKLLERRTGILIEAGHVRHNGRPVPVFEFRHLTFQEYLAGLALVEGRFPGRQRDRPLSENVAPLAGKTSEVESPNSDVKELAVAENWREAIRLCVTSCNDDDVDAVLLAILNPLPEEDVAIIARPRAVMAALCLADEPNASDAVAAEILRAFAAQVTRYDGQNYPTRTTLDMAAAELSTTRWASLFRSIFVEEFQRRDAMERENVGNLVGRLATANQPQYEQALRDWMIQQTTLINSGNEIEKIGVTLEIAALANQGRILLVPDLIDALFAMLVEHGPISHAAAEALAALSSYSFAIDAWQPREDELQRIETVANNLQTDHGAIRYLLGILRQEKSPQLVQILLSHVNSPNSSVRNTAVSGLGQLKDTRALDALIVALADPDNNVRNTAIFALSQYGDPGAVEPLLTVLADPNISIRSAAVTALGQLRDPRAVEPLLTVLADPNTNVRSAAATALGQLRDPRAVEPLLTILVSRDILLRRSAATALGQLGDPRAVEPLLTTLFHSVRFIGSAVAEALGQIRDPEAVEPLIAALSNSNSIIRRHAAYALGQIRDPRAIEPLLTTLTDTESSISSAAAQALSQLGSEIGITFLMSKLSDDSQEKRKLVLAELARTCKDEIDRKLLTRDLDGFEPFIDPQNIIDRERIIRAARRLELPIEEVRQRYEALAQRFGLRVEPLET